jgi:Collagen triple helix repeat (20 copies)/WD40-like Beta Propeller Repeat
MRRLLIVICAVSACGGNGSTGPSGPSGPAGATGQMGSTGPSGTVGKDGQAGAIGASGPSGPSGADGTNGMDATADMTPPLAPPSVWINQVGTGFQLLWRAPNAATPKLASYNIYRNGQLVESVLAAQTSTAIELAADSGDQRFSVSAVSVAGVEGNQSNQWIQRTDSRIAYATSTGGHRQLFVRSVLAPAPQPSPVLIDAAPTSDVDELKFSPDGQRLAWVGGGSAGGDLFVRSANGTTATLRLNATAVGASSSFNDLRWSPDGSLLGAILRKSDGSSSLWLADGFTANSAVKVADLAPVAVGSNASGGRNDPSDFAFTPDGTQLVYCAPGATATKSEAWVVPAVLPLGTPRAISGAIPATGPASTIFGVLSALVSPDGEHLILSNFVPEASPTPSPQPDFAIRSVEIWVADYKGAFNLAPAALGGIDNGLATGAWSWDSTRLAFTASFGHFSDLRTEALFQFAVGGGASHVLLSPSYEDAGSNTAAFTSGAIYAGAQSLDWLDDETLFASFAGYSGTLPESGGSFEVLGAAANYAVRVSPNGEYVAKSISGTDLVIYGTTYGGSNQRPNLAGNTDLNHASFRWFPDGERLLAATDSGSLVVVHTDLSNNQSLGNIAAMNQAGTFGDLRQVEIAPLGYYVRNKSNDP